MRSSAPRLHANLELLAVGDCPQMHGSLSYGSDIGVQTSQMASMSRTQVQATAE